MADNQIKVTLKLDGTQEFRSQLKAVGASAADLKKDFGAFSDAVGNAAANMAKIAAAATAAAAAIVGMTLANAKANEEILQLGEKTGASTDRIQELGFAAKQVGIDAEAIPGALEKFSISLAKLKTPTKDMDALLKDVADAEKDYNDAVADGNKSIIKASESEQKRVSSLSKQNAEIAKSNALHKGASKAYKDATVDSDKLSSAHDRAQKTVDRLRDKLIKAREALVDVDDGEGNLAKTLAKVNPALAEQLKNAKNADDAFLLLIDGVRKLNSVDEQNLVITAALGKSNINFAQLARLSKQELLAFFAEAQRTGQVISKDILTSADDLGDAVDILKGAFAGLKNNVLSQLNPALTSASKALTEFIVQNKDQLIAFATNTIPKVVKTIGDLFLLLTGATVQNPDAVALKIFTAFKDIGTAAAAAKPFIDAAFTAFDTFAKAVGFASGQQALFIIAGLKVSGLLTVLTTGFTVLVTSMRLFLAVLGLIRTFVAANLLLLTGWGAAIAAAGAIIFTIVDATIGWDAANQMIIDFFNELVALAPFILQEVVQLITDLGAKIFEVFSSIPTFIATILGPELTAQWIAIIDALLLGLESFVTDAIAAVMTFVNSPSWKAIVVAGAAAWAGLKAGAAAFFQGLLATATTFAANIGTVLFNGIAAGLRKLTAVASEIFSAISAKASSVIASISAAFAAVKSIFSSAPAAPAAPATTQQKFGPGFAGGGLISGAGSSTSDSILGRLSNGEFVVKARAVKKYGADLFHALNSGMLNMKGFATGGLVNLSNSLSGGPALQPAFAGDMGGMSGRPLTLVLPNGKKIHTRGVDESVAKSLEKDLRRSANSKATSLPDWY